MAKAIKSHTEWQRKLNMRNNIFFFGYQINDIDKKKQFFTKTKSALLTNLSQKSKFFKNKFLPSFVFTYLLIKRKPFETVINSHV